MVNPLHGFLLEFGISLPIGFDAIQRRPALLAEQEGMSRPRRLGNC